MIDDDRLIRLAQDAGDKIMEIYRGEIAVMVKGDSSPLTEADLASHHCICNGLKTFTPNIPILSEESPASDLANRRQWSTYWLIDPLDGTKEFIKRNGEFTVNIALIQDGVPVLGVVYAPVLGITYLGRKGDGAYRLDGNKDRQSIAVAAVPAEGDTWRVVGSRSHQSDQFTEFMSRLPEADVVHVGSSLKSCLVAEGKADLYPRLGPTSEWDTAAAQAIVEAAGGQVLELATLHPLRYNQRDTLLNPDFIVCAAQSSVWADSKVGRP